MRRASLKPYETLATRCAGRRRALTELRSGLAAVADGPERSRLAPEPPSAPPRVPPGSLRFTVAHRAFVTRDATTAVVSARRGDRPTETSTSSTRSSARTDRHRRVVVAVVGSSARPTARSSGAGPRRPRPGRRVRRHLAGRLLRPGAVPRVAHHPRRHPVRGGRRRRRAVVGTPERLAVGGRRTVRGPGRARPTRGCGARGHRSPRGREED